MVKRYLLMSFIVCSGFVGGTESESERSSNVSSSVSEESKKSVDSLGVEVESNEEKSINIPDLAYEDGEEIYRKIFGNVDQQEDMLFDTEVLVDGEQSGSAPTLIGKNCKIQADALKDCLEDYLDPEDIDIIDQYKDKDGFVEFKNLDGLSLKTKLNHLSMQVEVSLPPDKKKERSFSGRRRSRKGRSNVKPANVSTVVNFRVSQSFNRNKHSSSNTKNLILSSYLNLFGICAEGETTYQQSSRSKGKFHRDYTTLVYDWVEPDIMFRFGDIFSRSLSYQSPPRVWGFNINKDVERIKSEGFSSPIRITLLRTSTVEVYSDNHLIRTRTNVAPGTYILDDISYNNGANDIKIKIIDSSGHEEVLDESFFYESSYVPKGKFTFNGIYGYPEVNCSLNGRYDKKNPLLSLTLKYGLLSSTELGVGLLKNRAGKTYSYEIRNRNILGSFDIKFATSNYRENSQNIYGKRKISGKVYYGQYVSPSVNLFGKTNLNFSASIEKSDNFFRPYLAAKESDSKFNNISGKKEFDSVFENTSGKRRFSSDFDNILKREKNLKGKNTIVTYRANISNILSFNTGFSYSQKKTFDKKRSKSISLNISRGFGINNAWFSNGNTSANFVRTTETDGKTNNSFSIYCSLSLKNRVDFSSGYSRKNGSSTSYLSASHSPNGTHFSYDITAERSAGKKSDEIKRVKIKTNYHNHIFKGNLNHSRSNKGSSFTNVGAESAFYFADGRFAISRPNHSDGGFVLVTPTGDLEKCKIKFLDKRTKSGFMGGGAVLSNSRISSSVSRIDLRKIPDNISLKQDTIISQGQYRRGFIADIQGIKSITARGILVDSEGKTLEQVTGFAINKNAVGESPISFFTNSSGEFFLTELKPGKYKLTVNVQNTEDIELEIPKTTEMKKNTEEDSVLDLGTIVCKDSIIKGNINEKV